jgi:hypothetical protein
MADSLLLAALAQQHNPWRAEMYRSAALTLTNGVFTAFPFDTVVYDPNGNLTTGAGAKYTVPVDGYYACSSSISIQATAGSQTLALSLYKNGVEARRSNEQDSVAAGANNLPVSVFGIPCVATDTLQIFYFTPALAVNQGAALCWAQFAFVAPS